MGHVEDWEQTTKAEHGLKEPAFVAQLLLQPERLYEDIIGERLRQFGPMTVLSLMVDPARVVKVVWHHDRIEVEHTTDIPTGPGFY